MPSKPPQSCLDRLGFVAGLAAIVAFALVAAWSSGAHVEFDPVNGHFQNFNAAYRILHGQRPFVDFPAYLGMGPVLVPLPIIAALGGTLGASNAAYDLVSVLAVGLSSVIVARLCGSRPGVAWAIGALMTAIPWPTEHGNDSALAIRSFLPCLGALAVLAAARARARGAGELPIHAAVGAVAGLAPLWSNDYGLPTAAALSVTFLASFGRPGVRAGCLAAFATAATASFACGLCAVTGGHPSAWFRFNFGGVLADQFWYYDPAALGKVYGPADIPHDAASLAMVAPEIILCAAWMFRARDTRAAALATLCASAAGGAYLSGLAGTFQVRYFMPMWRVSLIAYPAAVATLWVALPSRLREAVPFPLRRAARSGALQPVLAAYSLAGAVAVFLLMAWGVDWKAPPTDDVPVPELGAGMLPSYLPAIELARGLRRRYDAAGLPPDRRLLSTYATATALVSGSRQDGPDYVIHALGDAGRAAFVASLDQGYRNVETIDPDAMLWGSWNVRTSWPFYRKLYLGWHPFSRTAWSLLWERRTVPLPPATPVACRVLPVDGQGFARIEVSGAPPGRWVVEVSAELRTAFRPIPVPLIGSHRLVEIVENYDGARRDVDGSSSFGEMAALVSNTWTARLADGTLAMPVALRGGSSATLSLRAWPGDRASLTVASCSATALVAAREVELPAARKPPRTIMIAPGHVVQRPQNFPARRDTRALYFLTDDPLAPFDLRPGDLVRLPDGKTTDVLLRDFRILAVRWPGGAEPEDVIRRLEVVPHGDAPAG